MNTLANGQLDALQASLRGQLLQADDAGYDSARAVWNAMIDRHPGFHKIITAFNKLNSEMLTHRVFSKLLNPLQ